jgi:hypothetical protein
MLAGLVQKASSPSESTAPINPARAASGSRYAIQPASLSSGRGARFGIDEIVSRIEGTYLAADTPRMAKKREPPKPTTWNIYKIATKAP